jgi:beta-galactosidase
MPEVHQQPSFDLSQKPVPIISGHLNLGGTNPHGQRISFNNLYMLRNDQPCIPVMGEFHFSRYAHQYWGDELLKIRAGGVDIVATYVFWNHIEEDEGQFDWTGNNNLRQFITLCGQHGLEAVVRIGPFAHGECRNGGIPDWLYGRPFPVRSNDERYLAYVRRLYEQIAAQLTGLLFKDGGPVIGIQLENEYMHAGAPWEVTFRQGTEWVPSGTDGADHILKLKAIAREVGLDVPIYTCTGWLGSPVPEGEVLPMQGGYVFTPWVPDPDFQQPPTREFLFRNRHQHPVINGTPTYDPLRYPYACCEIGGGTQDTYYHRNPVPPEAVEGLAFMNLAGGANLIGYYMYHGGTNPVGKHSFMNEYTVPRRSYDFQAPLREFGQTADSFRALRLLHLFLKDFGSMLAPMNVILPDNAATIQPDDTSSVRCAVRALDGEGFLFLNNYQDHIEMQDLHGLRFLMQSPDGDISIPDRGTLTLRKNVSAMLPFGITLSGIKLRYATTQLLTMLHDTYVFFAPHGMESEYALESGSFTSLEVQAGEAVERDGCTYVSVTPGMDALITLTNQSGQQVRLLTLSREQAEHTAKLRLWGKDRLLISEATAVADAENCILYSRQPEIKLSCYGGLEGDLTTPLGSVAARQNGLFTDYTISVEPKVVNLDIDSIAPNKAVIRISDDALTGVDNVYLNIQYVGDIGNCYMHGKLVSDNFYNGTAWEIGLKQIYADAEPAELFLLITPKHSRLSSQTPSDMAFVPKTDAGVAIIESIQAIPEYRVLLHLSP